MKDLNTAIHFAIMFCVLVVCAQTVSADFASNLMDEERLLIERINTSKQSIERLEKEAGVYSTRLYKPIRELALLQKSAGDYTAALDAFRRMQHIVHRNYGVYDAKQLESVNYIIDTYAHQGRALDIDTQQHFRYKIVEQSFEPDSEEMLIAKIHLADWYRGSGRFEKASVMYEDILDNDNIDADLRVRLLRADAMTQYLSGKCCASESLEEALALMDSESIETIEPTQAIVDYMDMAFIERGNVNVTRSDMDPAFLGFGRPRHVIELMTMKKSRNPNGETYYDFGERDKDAPPIATVGYPVTMCGNTYKAIVPGESNPEFSVSIEINDEGRPENISVVGDGPIKLKRYLKNSLQVGRYRPATSETGEFTAATLSFTQTFGQADPRAGSLSSVSEWGKMMVSQTCQISGLQRI